MTLKVFPISKLVKICKKKKKFFPPTLFYYEGEENIARCNFLADQFLSKPAEQNKISVFTKKFTNPHTFSQIVVSVVSGHESHKIAGSGKNG